ncbi:hypothetical protein [Clostridium perfringens]|uniref:hypothetical protein n=3 Tax=Clostridia TaxID=186801 RepID=UPI0028CDC24F|nr:hypothetical protein [Clostridium perfringens]MDT7918860.1 hypothetical protein [Clostridium perfringens]MDT7927866.1 hypothetical protein [Clostridium perfringens]MDT7938429.1 hypothetical protein [Clostridium perfringens]MDT8012361.1 hypothetical protein [Clostridium perfringens]
MKQTSQVKVRTHLHDRMKEIAKRNGNTITEEYEKIITMHIQNETQNQILAESQIETLINKKLNNIDEHISSYLGKIDKELSILYTTEVLTLQKILSVHADTDISVEDLMTYLEEKAIKTYKRSRRKK